MRVILLLFLLAGLSRAEDIYVAQVAAGADDGSSVANAKSMNWFTNFTSWTAGGGNVGAGDTIHFSGNVSNPVVCWNGGTAGSPLTFMGEAGSKWIAPTILTFSFVIYIGGSSYITCSNIWIECTANGLGKSFTNNITGFSAVGGSHLLLDHCVITNLYVRVPGGSETNSGSTGVLFNDGSDWIVRHSVVYQAGQDGVVFSRTTSGVYTNWLCDSNFIYGANHGVKGTDNSNTKVSGVYVRGNRIDGSYVWDGTGGVPSDYHHNCIYIWADNTGSAIMNYEVSGNILGPRMSTGTQTSSQISCTALGSGSYVSNYYVFNNQCLGTNGYQCMDGHIWMWGFTFLNTKVYNNSIDCANMDDGMRLTALSGSDVRLFNNIVKSPANFMLYNDGGAGLTQCNSNIYYGTTNFRYDSGGSESLATWQGRGYDANTIVADPKFILPGANLRLQSDSPAIGAGMNFNSLFTVDADWVTRGSSWDIGAFEFVPLGPRVVNISGTVRAGTMTIATP